MYDYEKEKLWAQSYVEASRQMEEDFFHQDRLERAMFFAFQELEEFEKEFNNFISRVEHLVFYRDLIKKDFELMTKSTLDKMKHILKNDYTREDLSKLSYPAYQEIRFLHELKRNYLKSIVNNYFSI